MVHQCARAGRHVALREFEPAGGAGPRAAAAATPGFGAACVRAATLERWPVAVRGAVAAQLARGAGRTGLASRDSRQRLLGVSHAAAATPRGCAVRRRWPRYSALRHVSCPAHVRRITHSPTPSSMAKGNRLPLDARLSKGHATGALLLRTLDDKACFHARLGPKGRGLAAGRDYRKGETLCTMPGRLVDAPYAPPGEVLEVRKPAAGRLGRWLVLHAATCAAPGNLVNTSCGSDADGGNNARIFYRKGATFATLRALRNIKAGEELLMAYGRRYTSKLRSVAEAECAARPRSFDWVHCPACRQRLQQWKLAKHVSGFQCRRRGKARAAQP